VGDIVEHAEANMKILSTGLASLAIAMAAPALASDQSPSQADYDCANYGECGAKASSTSPDDGAVVVESTRGMSLAGRLGGAKVTETTVIKTTTQKVASVRPKSEMGAVSGARTQRVTAPPRPVATSAANTRLKLAQGITFTSGSAELTAGARMNVDKLAASLLRPDKLETRFRIEGHTDAVGDATNNQILSERRAEAVVSYLVGKGVDRTRLEVAGYGESELLGGVVGNAAANRRVVSRLLN
jgi:outer membrane protein OmpA-like peptidoglycan-associated protein